MTWPPAEFKQTPKKYAISSGGPLYIKMLITISVRKIKSQSKASKSKFKGVHSSAAVKLRGMEFVILMKNAIGRAGLTFKRANHMEGERLGRLQQLGVLVRRLGTHAVSLQGLCLGIENEIKLQWSQIASSVPQASWVVTSNVSLHLFPLVHLPLDVS